MGHGMRPSQVSVSNKTASCMTCAPPCSRVTFAAFQASTTHTVGVCSATTQRRNQEHVGDRRLSSAFHTTVLSLMRGCHMILASAPGDTDEHSNPPHIRRWVAGRHRLAATGRTCA